MSDSGFAEHDPTPARRQRARQAGQVARSSTLVTAVVSLAAFVMLRFGVTYIADWLTQLSQQRFSTAPSTLNSNQELVAQLQSILISGLLVIGPLLVGLLVFALLANITQVGWLFLPQRILPQADRLWTINASHSWSERGVRAATSIVQLLALLSVGVLSVWNRREQLLRLGEGDLSAGVTQLLRFIVDTGLHVSLGLLIGGLADYAYRWWRHEQSLRMTAEELKEELQQTERRGARRPLIQTSTTSAKLETAAIPALGNKTVS
ncbi:MAG: EscU/YscU/HrcU family type III secretion system export apparatus switch protein [Planctomycetota bacterium]